MMRSAFPRAAVRIGLVCALLGLATSRSHGAIIIDNFTTTSSVSQFGTGTASSGPVMGSGILGARTLSLTVSSPLTAAMASAGLSPGTAQASFLGAYPTPNPNSNFELKETFAAVNATTTGLDSVSLSLSSSLGVTVTIIANGTSTYTATYPVDTTGTTRLIAFSSFSNPSVFSSLTSLEFITTFPNPGGSGPSVGFSAPILPTTAVPEPASLVLCGLAASLGLIGPRLRRR